LINRFPRSPKKLMNRRLSLLLPLTLLFLFVLFSPACRAMAGQGALCLDSITSIDSVLVATASGKPLLKKNESLKQVPASTLKLLTGLVALEHLGEDFRFPTRFFKDAGYNLIIKGLGDPLLISEVWEEIAESLAERIVSVNDLILDDGYFSPNIVIPGRKRSTNPYDAPVGALCANFNTVFFDRDSRGRIVSAEPQTPIIPFSRKKIRSLNRKKGRYAFADNQTDAARYAGELLAYFLRTKGVPVRGRVRMGGTNPADTAVFTYRSRFTMETVVRKMLAFSNNFIANQLFIGLGARIYGPPATLEKGARVVSDYAGDKLNLRHIRVVEGSGISRKNSLSAMDMLEVLKKFAPYRNLLPQKGGLYFKTGTLRGVSARAGYIHRPGGEPYCFVVFLRRGGQEIDRILRCLGDTFGLPANGTR